ncbi:ML5, partial [Symbiodinium sp. CCMP2456]
ELHLSSVTCDCSSRGNAFCIIFRPQLTRVCEGDQFEVEVSGLIGSSERQYFFHDFKSGIDLEWKDQRFLQAVNGFCSMTGGDTSNYAEPSMKITLPKSITKSLAKSLSGRFVSPTSSLVPEDRRRNTTTTWHDLPAMGLVSHTSKEIRTDESELDIFLHCAGVPAEQGKMWKTGKGTLKGRSRGRSNWAEGETTVVLTGLPRTLNADILLELVDEKFHRCYDFFYLPMYLDQLENTGLAYINFRDHTTAVECQRYFEGSIDWSGHISDRPCKAQWSSIQGYEANITRHRKAEWLEKNVPEDCKPMAFDEQGRRLPTLEVFNPLQPLHSTDSGKGGKYQRPGKGKQWERDWYGASKPHAGKGSNWPGWYSDRNIETDSRQSDSGYANAAFEPFDDSASWLQAAASWQVMEMTAGGIDDSWGNPNEGNMTSALDLYLASMDSTDRYSDEAYGHASGQTFEPRFPLQESFEKRADTFERDPSNTKVEDQKRLPKPLIPELPVLEHLQNRERGEKGSPQTSPQMSPSSTASEPGQLGLRKYACPNCKLIFAKWSACQHHVVSDMNCWCVLGEGRLPSDVTELQEKCKAAAEERPKDSEPTAAFVDEAIQDKVLRFQ